METQIRILMVDDVTRYQTLYRAAITDALPASVNFATNGEEALEKLDEPVPYDLLILDLNMPRLGGEETLKRIRSSPNFDNMPVIILTGDADQDKQRRLLEIGADDFVEKGAPPEIFVSRLKAQLRYKIALDRLSQIALDMDIFAAGVLHDIRNLETTIITIAELAKDYLATDPEGRKPLLLQDLQALEDKADHLGRYASEIIAMVRETKKPLSLTEQALTPLIDWAGRVASESKNHPRGLSVHIPAPLKPVIADKHFLKLVLLNIFQNAIKYVREGHAPELHIEQRAATPDPGRVKARSIVTCFRDFGRGIDAKELRRVFEPFVRGKRQHGKGFGLGLALVAKVTTAMGGRVWAECPKDGQPGTVICLELPEATSPDYLI